MKAGKDLHLPAIVHCLLKGTRIRPIQPCGNEAFLKIPTGHYEIK
jgi:hypothetical protein